MWRLLSSHSHWHAALAGSGTSSRTLLPRPSPPPAVMVTEATAAGTPAHTSLASRRPSGAPPILDVTPPHAASGVAVSAVPSPRVDPEPGFS